MEWTKGKLYIVPTPIGNLEDITLRALRILQEADVIACEDTRRSIKLLNHYDIKGKLISYHQHNEILRAGDLLEMVEEGKTVAIISDAGMPGISDPGGEIIRRAIEKGIPFEVLPGPCALVNGIVASGFGNASFAYYGFLPRDKKPRGEILEVLASETKTAVLYEAPHRLQRTLEDFQKVFPEREIALCRELTKLHEDIFRGSIGEAIQYAEANPRGEYVLVLRGGEKKEPEDVDIRRLLSELIKEGYSKKDAVKRIAEKYDIPKNEVYRESLQRDSE